MVIGVPQSKQLTKNRYPLIIPVMASNEQLSRIQELVSYWQLLGGDEKGEAQVFCDRLFKAFGHQGYKEAGAILEYRIRRHGETTRYADLRWEDRVLIEMKGRGEDLRKHYRQAFEYWIKAVPKRPRYVILCNFDEFWIYDFDLQLDEPVDTVRISDLPDRYTALNFLLPTPKTPVFRNDLVAVTRTAAANVAGVFNSLVLRGEDRTRSQRFVLQCVMGMFSEDFGLLPKDLFTELVIECEKEASSYDLLGSLFRQMNSVTPARAGRFKNVRYFNGGLFAQIDAIDLTKGEIELLAEACKENWAKVKPAIFGTLFESSMGKNERHAYGAHFTSEADISKVVSVTIEEPWRARLESASTLNDLLKIKASLHDYSVLDPACGSGNFLYLAYLQLRRIENDVLGKVYEGFGKRAALRVAGMPYVQLQQFYGIDSYSFAVELAKVTLLLAKEVALRETTTRFKSAQINLLEKDLPLDNLDAIILCEDALFCKWPSVNAIIGNPPYQSKNKIQQELGPEYIHRVRNKYPEVSGRADYCVYWFRRAHDELPRGGRAGLVGTNTIRQNYSREGGLDYILNKGGTILDSISSQVWSGDAAVHVSIVNWIKGQQAGLKKLYQQLGDNLDSPWSLLEVELINSALSAGHDVTQAEVLTVNRSADVCDQGQTHGHKGYLVDLQVAKKLIADEARNREVVLPYLIGDELLSGTPPLPERCVIDFHPRDVVTSASFKKPFEHLQNTVLPTRKEAAKAEEIRNRKVLEEHPDEHVNLHHKNFLNKWWLLSFARADLIKKIVRADRYIVCSRVTKRPIFEFVHRSIRPGDALQVFTLDDDYSFGILQSNLHWLWFNARCSTLKGDFRYTSNTVFDTFPWPQSLSIQAVAKVATNAVTLRKLRRDLMEKNGSSLRDLYRLLELPGSNELRDAHDALDSAVRQAYGMTPREEVLAFLLKLNSTVKQAESNFGSPFGPGLPPIVRNRKKFVTQDCMRIDF